MKTSRGKKNGKKERKGEKRKRREKRGKKKEEKKYRSQYQNRLKGMRKKIRKIYLYLRVVTGNRIERSIGEMKLPSCQEGFTCQLQNLSFFLSPCTHRSKRVILEKERKTKKETKRKRKEEMNNPFDSKYPRIPPVSKKKRKKKN